MNVYSTDSVPLRGNNIKCRFDLEVYFCHIADCQSFQLTVTCHLHLHEMAQLKVISGWDQWPKGPRILQTSD